MVYVVFRDDRGSFLKVVFERKGLGQAPLPCLASVISRQSIILVLTGITYITISARFHSFKLRNGFLDFAINTNAGARDLIPRDKWWWFGFIFYFLILND